jgi:hypothetical protein
VGLLRRAVLVPLVLCLMVAFAVEPTTSTQFDLAEGRGVVVVHGQGHQAPARSVIELTGRALIGAPVLVALLLLVPLVRRPLRDIVSARGPSVSRWRTPVLRGPPVLV